MSHFPLHIFEWLLTCLYELPYSAFVLSQIKNSKKSLAKWIVVILPQLSIVLSLIKNRKMFIKNCCTNWIISNKGMSTAIKTIKDLFLPLTWYQWHLQVDNLSMKYLLWTDLLQSSTFLNSFFFTKEFYVAVFHLITHFCLAETGGAPFCHVLRIMFSIGHIDNT